MNKRRWLETLATRAEQLIQIKSAAADVCRANHFETNIERNDADAKYIIASDNYKLALALIQRISALDTPNTLVN